MASQASDDKKTAKGKHILWYFKLLNFVLIIEIGDVAGVAEVTIRQSYKLMYPKALDLFPSDFRYYNRVHELPTS